MCARRKTNRRQFLKGESTRDALAALSLGAGEADAGPLGVETQARQTPSDYLLQVGRQAMACDFHVYLNAGQHAGAVEAASEALNLVQRLEEQMSVYRPHSELSTINREAAQAACAVEPRLFELLCRCVDWSGATGGAYDITAGPLVKVWGFYARAGRFPEAEQVRETLQCVGSRHLELDREQRSIRFRQPGLELNLGSVGKGYALDRFAEILETAGVDNFLIHGGQSSILARCPARGEWRAAVVHCPATPAAPSGVWPN